MVDMVRCAVEAASRAFCVPASAILGPDRGRRVCAARRAAYVLLRERGWSTPQIGRALNLDHSSIVYGCKRVPKMPPSWHEAYAKARESLGSPPKFRIVYHRPIGPPLPWRNKVNCGRPNAPLPPHPDELWARLLGRPPTLSYTRRNPQNPLISPSAAQ